MNCEQANLLFEQALAEPDGQERRRVMRHLSACDRCRQAFRALAYLRAERSRPVPEPLPGTADEALRLAMADGRRRGPGPFWRGAAAGALAAGIAALAVLWVLGERIIARGADAPAAVTLALHQPKDVSIAIEAPQALSDAEIHVSLRGAVDLRGFDGERDIRWSASLARGINELTLPITATGEQGGQLRVVVRHGKRQKTFLVDVHVARIGERRTAPSV